MLNIGCHLSISAGLLPMVQVAEQIQANTFQCFLRSPRGSKMRNFQPEELEQFNRYLAEHQFAATVVHAPYTLNACSTSAKTQEFAELVMRSDLELMEQLACEFYNFHPGNHLGQGVAAGIRQIAELLNRIIDPSQQTTILLETMAGKGTEIGSTFAELRDILAAVRYPEKMGVCLDTCHVWDAGYDLVNQLDQVLAEFDQVLGMDTLKIIHLNDSKNSLATHKDRHACIGAGSLGIESMQRIINHPWLQGRYFILETPNNLSGYAYEIAQLRQLYHGT